MSEPTDTMTVHVWATRQAYLDSGMQLPPEAVAIAGHTNLYGRRLNELIIHGDKSGWSKNQWRWWAEMALLRLGPDGAVKGADDE